MWQKPFGTTEPLMPFGPFVDDALAASQSDVQLTFAPVANDGVVMPVEGHVVGIMGTLSAAGSAGSLTVGVSIDGVEDTDTTQTITTEQEFYAQFNTDGDAPGFEAGEQIGVEITTSADWNGTTADLAVWLIVALHGFNC